ncbi:MAG: phosphatidylserine decarboxylase family protein [Nitrospinaceae bacterium]|nr:phosphatidylserine decarboxylase family protein [Nitrospinaceae bacterium]NIR56202.1 phosphatidylserine decarboxylase family protein [Nitrospinaceae bacterium]NIS86658.1 phosphatidylserine decarboxylase family protein [Nitrospinaceae bacterium]NIT83491.1 phosphatidylserine decarboxylase family protein [Nitrospinaceae bacterium]NIU45696.1 phosphatidylserine decarboxylase family protein [Nitrospinaceae bacterium]
MKIPIASDGYRFIIPLFILTILLVAMSQPWAAGISGLGFLFVLNFFRDPERAIPEQPGVVVSPADGKVVEIVEEQDALLDEPYTRISIFLNIFNVHVQRTPVAGTIEKVKYNKGKFLNAASHKASLDNEQNAMIIDNGNQKVLVKQIAGLIARRIVCWAKEGDNYNLGQRFGLIRFGSRVDLFLPLNSRIEVSLGDHVSGGSSIIGYLKQ